MKQALGNTVYSETKSYESTENIKTQKEENENTNDLKSTGSNITQIQSNMTNNEEGVETYVENDDEENNQLSESTSIEKQLNPVEDLEGGDFRIFRTRVAPEISQPRKINIL